MFFPIRKVATLFLFLSLPTTTASVYVVAVIARGICIEGEILMSEYDYQVRFYHC